MIKPPVPANEEARLAALHALEILDTPAEERFDRITRLAQTLLDVPIAYVALIDANRQWFKSCQGLGGAETSRDVSFCGWAIMQDEMLVIPDAYEDKRFADNPLVTGEPFIRFYCGQSLKSAEGLNVGTLCLVDRKPRALTQRDHDRVLDLARMAERELRLADTISMQRRMLAAQKQTADLLHSVIPLGVTLLGEGDFDTLLETLLLQARSLCAADAALLYLRSDDGRLRRVALRIASADVFEGCASAQRGADAEPTEATDGDRASTIVAAATQAPGAINLSDVAEAADRYDLSDLHALSRDYGLEVRSALTMPLRSVDDDGHAAGVLQLINAVDPDSGQVIAFDPEPAQTLEALSSLGAAAIDGYARQERMRQQIQALRIRIDATRRDRDVAEITETAYFRDLLAKADKFREDA